MDKIMNSEKTDKHDGGGYLSALDRLAEKILETGAEIELQISVKPFVQDIDAIDVTPQSELAVEELS